MNAQIIGLIDRYGQSKDFARKPLTEEDLKRITERLQVNLPQQYLDYLNAYGHGGIAGVEVLGKGLDGSLPFLDATTRLRASGLPDNLVVVENCDDWVYCIDCDNGKIVSWDPVNGTRDDYACFDDYLLESYRDAIENL